MGSYVRSRVQDGVGYLTLADPERRNAMTADLVDEALEVHREFAEQGLKVGVLNAVGTVFCAGGDLKAKRVPGVPPAGVHLIEAFETSPLMWIASVHGPALGAALHLISTCPRAILSASAWLAIPELIHGRYPRPILAELAESIGPRRALRLAMTGERLSAQDALALGLIERVVAPEELEGETIAEAQALNAIKPDALDLAREAWRSRLGLRKER